MIEKFSKPIYVAKPFMPPINEFREGLKSIWESQQLTNNGPLLKQFEDQVSHYIGTNVSMFNNGTSALQIGLQALGITGEVITTPFTFVATSTALTWNNISPVFVDIEPDFYTLDPAEVEAAITPQTTAILAVHVYGYPCKLEALADIAKRHNIKLIYDAAHAFGVKVDGKSIAEFGDLSMFSFHATKLFHSIEGGMLAYQNDELKLNAEYLRNFGFKNETEVVVPGSNAKMNELQALMGILVLKYFPEILEKRKAIAGVYLERLKDVPGIRPPPMLGSNVEYNYSYFPVEVDQGLFGISRDRLYEQLREYNIFARRYFYPLVSDFECYRHLDKRHHLSMARKVASRILTLPIYFDLKIENVERICDVITFLSRK